MGDAINSLNSVVKNTGNSVNEISFESASHTAKHAQSTNMTRIYLVRHGQTELNVSGVLRGHLDPNLDALGILQAKMLGEVIGQEEVQLLVSSPLKRAVETATEIAIRAAIEVEIEPRLIDRDYGPWAGKSKETVITKFGSLEAAPEIEPESKVLARSVDAVMDVARRVPNGSAVIVSHDAVKRLLLSALDTKLKDISSIPQETGCFNIIELKNNEWSVLGVNHYPSRNGIPGSQLGAGNDELSESRIQRPDEGDHE